MIAPTVMEIFALEAAAATALRTGLLEHLAASPATPVAAAAALGLETAGVSLVLEVLRTAGLLEYEAGRYRPTTSLQSELIGPGGDAHSNAAIWAGTGALLATGKTLLSGDGAERGQVYAAMVGRLGAMFEGPSAALARALAPLLPKDARVLDVGAGSGIWSLALLSQRADLRATALDLEAVLPSFEELARTKGLAARVDLLAGDYLTATLPQRCFHAAIFANVLHLEPATRARAVLAHCAQAVAPGGRVVIVDAFPEALPEAERRHAAYALHLALRLPGARPHPEAEVRGWLSELGFPQVERVALDDDFVMAALVAE